MLEIIILCNSQRRKQYQHNPILCVCVCVLIEGGNNIPLHNTTQYLVHQQTDTKCISGFVNSIQVSFYVLFNLGNLISFYFSLIFGQSRLQPWAIGIPWRLPCLDFFIVFRKQPIWILRLN